MATSFSLYTFSSLLLLSLSTTILLLPTTNGSLLDHICRQTRNPPICSEYLSQDAHDTLPHLARTAVQKAGFCAYDCQRTFATLLDSTKLDPKTKAFYGQCMNIYSDANDVLNSAGGAVDLQLWDKVYKEAREVIGYVDKCERLFDNRSPVHKESEIVRVAAEVMEIISKTL